MGGPHSAWSAALVLAALLGAGPAAAADRCETDPSCQDQLNQAAELASQSRYDEALVLYQRAFNQWKEPRLLLNIGRCHFRIGRAHKALASFTALQQALPDADAELAARLRQFIADAQAAIADETASKPGQAGEDSPLRPLPPGLIHGDTVGASADDRCEAEPACRALTEQAAALAAQTRYEEALVLYRRAFERFAAPRLLINIGRCNFRIGRARLALESFRAFRLAAPSPSPELVSLVEHFVTDARLALVTDEGNPLDGEEPAPAPLDPRGDSLSYRLRHDQLGRPLWRIGVGGGAIVLGALVMGLGIGELAADGHCVTASATAMGLCATSVRTDGQRTTQLVDGITPGIALLFTGSLLAIGGLVLVALPARRVKVSWLLPAGAR